MCVDESQTDEQLMVALGQGETSAFEILVRRHQEPVWRVAYRFLHDGAEAEDIAQEAFMRVLEAASRYRPVSSFRSYLCGIVARLCIDRRRKRQPLYRAELPESLDTRPGPAQTMADRERCAAVSAAIQRLRPRERMAVVLKYYEGFASSQISEALDATPARKRLERELAGSLEK